MRKAIIGCVVIGLIGYASSAFADNAKRSVVKDSHDMAANDIKTKNKIRNPGTKPPSTALKWQPTEVKHSRPSGSSQVKGKQ